MELFGSLSNISGSVSASVFTGSYIGDGAGLYNLPASGVTGLNLSQISTGSISASLSPEGFNVNTDTSITGSLIISGDTEITGALTASGLIYPTTDGGERTFLQTDGNGNLTLHYVESMIEPIFNGESFTLQKGTPVYVSGSQGADPIVFVADAADPNKMPVIYIVDENLESGQIGIGILLGKIEGVDTTGYAPGTEVFVAAGGGWSSSRPTGSGIVQSLGIVTKEGNGGQGIVLNPGPNSLPNITTNKLWIGDTTHYPIEKTVDEIGLVTTSSLTSLSSSVAQTDVTQSNRLDSIEGVTGSYATTGSNLFIGTQTISGSVLPSVDNEYDLGSPSFQWRDVYISSGSLYIDGTKVISSTTQELTITTDEGQSIKILEAGSDSIVIQTADGDIELKSSGGGDVLLDPTNGIVSIKGTTQIQDGFKITSSGGTNVVFGNDVIVSGSINLTGTIDGVDLAQFKSDMDSMSGSNGDRLDLIEISTGSLNSFTSSINTTIKNKLNNDDVISGSIQVDITGTSGYTTFSSSIALTDFNQNERLDTLEGRYVTTGSNNFYGNQYITGSLTVSNNLTVLGSSSIVYSTASQLIVEDNVIVVNSSFPAERFAGLEVHDSGSNGSVTASLFWDGLNNRWIYQNTSEAHYGGGMFIAGPRNTGSLGDEPGLTSGVIPKSIGGDHIGDSIISELSGSINISGSLVISGSTTSTQFIKSGGTSSQFLKADGSVDSSTYLTSHPSVTAAASSDNSGRTYIQDILLDTFGHITGITTATETVTDTNNFVTGATFGTGDGIITLTRNDGNTITVDLDGRYLQSHPTVVAAASSNNSGRTYIQDILLDSFGHITGITTADETVVNTDTNYYVTGATFGTGDGIITLTRNDGNTVTVDLDGRYLESFDITTQTDPKYLRSDTNDEMSGTLKVYSTIGDSDNVRTGVAHYDDTAMVSGVGGQIVLGYKYTSAGDYTEGAIIKMYKENGTSGEYGSGLKFQVRNTGVNLSTKMTLDPSGNLSVTGTISATNFSGTSSGTNTGDQTNISGNAATATALTSMNISQFTNDSGYITGISFANVSSKPTTLSGYGITDALSNDSDSEQDVGGRHFRFNHGTNRINIDPRWNESGYDADLGVFHMYSTTAAGVQWGRTGLALYNGSAYQYLTTKGSTTGLFANDSLILTAGNYTSYAMAGAGYSANQNLNTSSTVTFGRVNASAGSDYPVVATSTQRYIYQARNTSNTVNSVYGWWWFMDTNFNMGFHADGAADRLTLTRDGNFTVTGSITSNGITTINNGTPSGATSSAANAHLRIDSSGNQYIEFRTSSGSSGIMQGTLYTDNGRNAFIGFKEYTGGSNYGESIHLSITDFSGSDAGSGIYLGASSDNLNGVTTPWFSIRGGTSYFYGNVLPDTNNSRNLGSASVGWANVYTNDLHLSNMNKPEGNDIDGTNGNWTIQEGAENLYIINNNNGKKFKISLEEII